METLVWPVVFWFALTTPNGPEWHWDIKGYATQADCLKAYSENIQKYHLPRNEHACTEQTERWKVDYYRETQTAVRFSAVKE